MIRMESHFSARVVEVFFDNGYVIRDDSSLKNLKDAWMAELKKWHSPYTCVFDVRSFQIEDSHRDAFVKMIQFFKQFHMKKIIGFADANSQVPSDFPFEIVGDYQTAISQTGLSKEGGGLKRNLDDLRSRIAIENDFNAHVIEINFLAPTHFETSSDIQTLKSKLQNILRQWHSPYSILINCVNTTFSEEARKAFPAVERFLKAFFCKQIIGYAPKESKENYPFKMFRSRHLAAADIEHSGIQSGAVANCSTRGS